jgi:dUTP pyrophosphatase
VKLPKIKFSLLHSSAKLPTREHESDAGIDLYALEDVDIYPGDTVKVRTGVCMEMPDEWNTELTVGMAHIEDRSSVGSKGLHHTAGVVDHGYNKGEIVVCIANLRLYDVLKSLRIVSKPKPDNDFSLTYDKVIQFDFEPYKVKAGDKLCQIVLQPVYKGRPTEVALEEMQDRARKDRGFGSSGK